MLTFLSVRKNAFKKIIIKKCRFYRLHTPIFLDISSSFTVYLYTVTGNDRNEHDLFNVHYYCMSKIFRKNLGFQDLNVTKVNFRVKVCSLSFNEFSETFFWISFGRLFFF